MIEVTGLTKTFKEVKAVNNVSIAMKDREVFGLVGTNGAGKSTMLRLLAGVLKPDAGQIIMDSEGVYDNPGRKAELFFIPNDFYFFPNATPRDMEKYFGEMYPRFDHKRYEVLLKDFGLKKDRRISEFSKGMKRQTAILLGICSTTKYILCDETFDGLDPVMRQAVKSLFAKDMEDRGLTPVITSHNLREIEDICDHIGLLHKGGILLSEDLGEMKTKMQKVQCVFASEGDRQSVLQGMHVVREEKRGRLDTFIVRADREEVENRFRGVNTIFFEILPLTLEEIFISETEGAGYDIKKFILD